MKTTLICVLLASTIATSVVSADAKKPAPATPPATAIAPRRIEITVTPKGFEPSKLVVAKAQPVTLVFTRKTDRTCAKRVVVQLGDGKKIAKELPLDTPVEIAATFAKTGELTYACGMDMISGVITVQ
jgi:plastocyanin domain-containing protein